MTWKSPCILPCGMHSTSLQSQCQRTSWSHLLCPCAALSGHWRPWCPCSKIQPPQGCLALIPIIHSPSPTAPHLSTCTFQHMLHPYGASHPACPPMPLQDN